MPSEKTTVEALTRFLIGRDGSVSNARNVSATLPDSNVVACVARAFYGMDSPFPEGGVVTVTYPLVFHRDDRRVSRR